MLYHFNKNIIGTVNLKENDILFPFKLTTILLVMMLKCLLIQSDVPWFFVFMWKQFAVLCNIKIKVQNLNPFWKLSLHYDCLEKIWALLRSTCRHKQFFFSVFCEVSHIFEKVRFLEKCVPILWPNCSTSVYFFSRIIK